MVICITARDVSAGSVFSCNTLRWIVHGFVSEMAKVTRNRGTFGAGIDNHQCNCLLSTESMMQIPQTLFILGNMTGDVEAFFNDNASAEMVCSAVTSLSFHATVFRR